MSDGRNAAIIDAHRRGVPEAELARAYDVSRQRIHQIVRRAGKHVQATDDRMARYARQEHEARVELAGLLAERRTLNVRIRRVLTRVRDAHEEQGAMGVDRLLGV